MLPQQVNMLNTQYRMHPAISSFPSQHFYNGELLNHLERQVRVSELAPP